MWSWAATGTSWWQSHCESTYYQNIPVNRNQSPFISPDILFWETRLTRPRPSPWGELSPGSSQSSPTTDRNWPGCPGLQGLSPIPLPGQCFCSLSASYCPLEKMGLWSPNPHPFHKQSLYYFSVIIPSEFGNRRFCLPHPVNANKQGKNLLPGWQKAFQLSEKELRFWEPNRNSCRVVQLALCGCSQNGHAGVKTERTWFHLCFDCAQQEHRGRNRNHSGNAEKRSVM